MEGNTKRALNTLRKLLETQDIHGLLPSLIGLLRNNIYAKYLKSLGKSEKEISGLLSGIHPYVLQKALSARISYKDLLSFYTECIRISTDYKVGRGKKDIEL
jgi:hypothetical protein